MQFCKIQHFLSYGCIISKQYSTFICTVTLFHLILLDRHKVVQANYQNNKPQTSTPK